MMNKERIATFEWRNLHAPSAQPLLLSQVRRNPAVGKDQTIEQLPVLEWFPPLQWNPFFCLRQEMKAVGETLSVTTQEEKEEGCDLHQTNTREEYKTQKWRRTRKNETPLC